MTIAYLSLGSNLKTPERQIRQSIHRIKKTRNIHVITISPLHFNKAIGRKSQPDFCNCVIKISTSQPVKKLLKQCLAFEKQQYRVRRIRWGARTLDIDILLFGEQAINLPNLIIPHPRMHERDFVLIPLRSVASLAFASAVQ